MAALKEFKKIIKERGFRLKWNDTKEMGGTIFTHNIYVHDDEEIDLASSTLRAGKKRFTLMFYKRMNY